MDAVRPRERLISILNDNDSPSFAVRPKLTSYPHLIKQERASLHSIDSYYSRDLPTSTPSTPPLLRLDSTSSKASSSTMDSPSPKTPLYQYDAQLIAQYDPLLRQDVPSYLPSPSTITPLMDGMMMISTPSQDPMLSYSGKPMNNDIMPQVYPALPNSPTIDGHTIPTTSSSSSNSNSHLPPTTAANVPAKKNKYPCPYASSHHCTATFTTSGHAARHGKKHTGEKGVHCPVCNKAFTRKDNMKQHERTHKASASGSNSDETTNKRSKAAITKDAARVKNGSSEMNQSPNKAGLIHSPLSEVVSIDPGVMGTASLQEDPGRYNDLSITENGEPVQDVSAYPPLGDEPVFGTLAQLDRNAGTSLANAQAPVQRAFSDLDTLALAAAYDPYSRSNAR